MGEHPATGHLTSYPGPSLWWGSAPSSRVSLCTHTFLCLPCGVLPDGTFLYPDLDSSPTLSAEWSFLHSSWSFLRNLETLRGKAHLGLSRYPKTLRLPHGCSLWVRVCSHTMTCIE